LRKPTEDDLPAKWMTSLLDLREKEEKLFEGYSTVQERFINTLNTIVSVGNYIASHPCK